MIHIDWCTSNHLIVYYLEIVSKDLDRIGKTDTGLKFENMIKEAKVYKFRRGESGYSCPA